MIFFCYLEFLDLGTFKYKFFHLNDLCVTYFWKIWKMWITIFKISYANFVRLRRCNLPFLMLLLNRTKLNRDSKMFAANFEKFKKSNLEITPKKFLLTIWNWKNKLTMVKKVVTWWWIGIKKWKNNFWNPNSK